MKEQAKAFSRAFFVSLSLVVAAVALAALTTARADGWESLPESRHQRVLGLASLFDEQTSLAWRNGGRAWGAIGAHYAMLEATHWFGRPQLIAHASANASFRLKSDLALLTETVDARVGLSVDWDLSESARMSVGWTHYSGHVSDDVQDRFLFGSNLGYEQLRGKLVLDLSPEFRMHLALEPYIGAEPARLVLAAKQELMVFPYGISASRKESTPYFAVQFEQSGIDFLTLTTQAQAGLLFGNRSRAEHEPGYRAAIAYYNGLDPRLKYQAFLRARAQFVLIGLFVDF